MTKARGFTLVELVMVIVITGIIAGMVAVFIKPSVDSYTQASRRSLLTDAADTALRRIARDVRLAVPNTVLVSGNTAVQFVPTQDGGRYRLRQSSSPGGEDVLGFTSADTSFQVIGPAPNASNGDFLVIYNTGQKASPSSSTYGFEIVEGNNRRTITGVAGGIVSFSSTFPLPDPLLDCGDPYDPRQCPNRFQVVPATGPVTYSCMNTGLTAAGDGTGTLNRLTGYGWGSAPSSGGSVLANHVSDCAFVYATGVGARSGLLTMRLTLSYENESITLLHQIHVDNQP